MKSLQNAIEDYIALRRSLGFKLNDMAADLTKFASFLEQKAAPYITTALALEWAMQSTDHLPSHWARRLGFVRVFARHWSATDPRTEIPPAGLLPFRAQRARPYLYTEQEIQRLLVAAKSLSPASGLRPWTYHCLFGLLAVSGLRISEAIKRSGKMWIFTSVATTKNASPCTTFNTIKAAAGRRQPKPAPFCAIVSACSSALVGSLRRWIGSPPN
jgi:integrase/recombinase XerD